MDTHQSDSLLIEQPTLTPPDEFASGPLNSTRRLFIRLVSWFTRPGYLPPTLTWLLVALIVTDLVYTIARFPKGYWIDSTSTNYLWFFDIPFSLGPWLMLVLCIAYIILLSLLLAILNSKPAFILWLILTILHLQSFSANFRCYRAPSYSFINLKTCDGWLFANLVVETILFGFIIAVAVKLGSVPLLQNSHESSDNSLPAWIRKIKWGIIVWIMVTLITFFWMAFSPQPEWHLIQPEHIPPARAVASLVYNPSNQKVVFFGGTVFTGNAWVDLNDTWEWDGTDWQQLNPSTSPSPRRSIASVYDEKNNEILLFGGGYVDPTGRFSTLDDTWIWDGTNWTQVSPANHPPSRMKAAIYYDPVQEKVFLFGGYFYDSTKQENIFYDDAWSWDGKNWNAVALKTPKVVNAANMLYDRKHQLPLMVDNDGIWSIFDQEWYQPDSLKVPIGRSESQLTYDSVHQQTILFGGYRDQNKFNDTWAYDGNQWNKVITRESPTKRTGHSLFFDTLRGKIVLIGGFDGKVTLNDMWELRQP